jgi:hypothetical protein
MFAALITIAVILILYGVVSKPLDARGITSAMIFTAAWPSERRLSSW